MTSGEKSPLVSVIMAAYNAGATIGDAIGSVLAQTFEDLELLVINDCSADETRALVLEMAKIDPRIRLLDNAENLGVSKSRKRGLEAAKGEWIAILDSDDLWERTKLEKQLALARQSGGELLFTASAFMDDQGKPIDWQLHVPETISYRELLKQNVVSNSSVLVRKSLYEAFYALGDEMHEDFAVWLSITRTGRCAYGIDEPLLIYRLASSSKSSNKLKAARMNWNTYRYIGLNPLSSFYYMCWYTLRGVLKYRHLR